MTGRAVRRSRGGMSARRSLRDLRRRRDRRMIGGVASGLAEWLDVDPSLVRVLFAVATVAGNGLGAVLYLAMWALVPEQDTAEDVLADRLERGEISAEEYRTIARDIGR